MKTLREVLRQADQDRVAIGHFNFSDLVAFNAIVAAARELKVPVMAGVSEGEREFTDLVIVADTAQLTPPCGTCRQIIWEFCKEASITLTNLRGGREVVTIRELLPRAFDARFLKEVHKGQ